LEKQLIFTNPENKIVPHKRAENVRYKYLGLVHLFLFPPIHACTETSPKQQLCFMRILIAVGCKTRHHHLHGILSHSTTFIQRKDKYYTTAENCELLTIAWDPKIGTA
jgi:hypothetical protein